MSNKKDSLRVTGYKAIQSSIKPPKDLWEKLDKEVGLTMEEPPKDSFTVTEFADHYQISETGAQKKLIFMLKKGMVTRKAYLLGTGTSRRRMFCYQVVQK